MTFTATQRSRGGRGRKPSNVLTFLPRSLPTTDGTAALAPARHWTEPYYTRLARAQKQQTALMLAPCTSIVPYGFWDKPTLTFGFCEFCYARIENGIQLSHRRVVSINSGDIVQTCTRNALHESAFSCTEKKSAVSGLRGQEDSTSTLK